jgi:DNA ligase-1
VKYIELVDLYEEIGATTKRLEITRYIVDFLKKTPARVIDKIVYLTQGKLYPDFAGVDMGIAEKTALKALSAATGLSLEKVERELRGKGDIGTAAEGLLKVKKQATLSKKELLVQDVYDALDKIAGQQEREVWRLR